MQRSIGSALRIATATARRITADSSRYLYRARCVSWQLEHEGWNHRTIPFDDHMFEAQGCLKSSGLPFGARSYAKKAKGAKKDKKEKKETSVEASDGEEIETVDFPVFESLLGSSVTALEQELGKLRTGRAVPGMLDSIPVEVYGETMPLQHIGMVAVRDSQLLAITLYDAANVSAVEKALVTSALSLNPVVEGDVILVPIPALNSDTKKEICKMVARAGEEAKKSIRTHRKKAMDLLKKAEKAGISEDVVKREEKQVQNIVDERTKAVDAMCNKKHKAIMEAS